MRRGLVLGKFMPIHRGHIQLIEFASERCDSLVVWVCVSNEESMPAELRLKWVKDIFGDDPGIEPLLFQYDESVLPNTSESSSEVSKIWSDAIRGNLPPLDVVFSSEKYGDYLADYLNIEHSYYPPALEISASDIRKNPYKNWDLIPNSVKPYYFRKICILGTESTGKSTLCRQLAEYFNAGIVSEVGREVVENSNTCTPGDLLHIAEAHAARIIDGEKKLKRMLFLDTNIHTTRSYSRFLFGKELSLDSWIESANLCELYLYLDKDAPFVQDGTRLSEEDRNSLDLSHRMVLEESGIDYKLIRGNWKERFERALGIIQAQFGISNEARLFQ